MSAKVDRNRDGEDPQGLRAEHESDGPEGICPKDSGVTLPTDEMIEAGSAALDDCMSRQMREPATLQHVYLAMRAKELQSTSPIEVGGLREALIELKRFHDRLNDEYITGDIRRELQCDLRNIIDRLSQSSSPVLVDGALIERARYCVNNPSAWDNYNEAKSELIRELVAALAIRQPFEGGE